jgi:hypothetical protein
MGSKLKNQYWKITINGSSILEDRIDNVFEMIRDMDVYDHLLIHKVEMDEEDYFNLNEFDGF